MICIVRLATTIDVGVSLLNSFNSIIFGILDVSDVLCV